MMVAAGDVHVRRRRRTEKITAVSLELVKLGHYLPLTFSVDICLFLLDLERIITYFKW